MCYGKQIVENSGTRECQVTPRDTEGAEWYDVTTVSDS